MITGKKIQDSEKKILKSMARYIHVQIYGL